MQKTVIITLAAAGALAAGYFFLHHGTKTVPASELRNVYNQWKVEYKIQVGAAEDETRFNVFSQNYGKIAQHNRLLGRSYTLGLNSFSHLTQEEFSATHLGLKVPSGFTAGNATALPTGNLQSKVDWTPKLNAVKNQGQCGSCWAFSAVGALEGLFNVKSQNGEKLNLAEQELVDCAGSFGNNGCNGGLMDSAFKYVISVGGLASESAYPYTAADGTCKTGLKRSAKISSFADVTANSAAALKAALNKQPVAVAIEADTSAFQSYKSGVLTSTACGTNLDHGVVAVGYNDEDRTPYYKVRNSWGASWGESGYVRIAIVDGPGICGIHKMASYPIA